MATWSEWSSACLRWALRGSALIALAIAATSGTAAEPPAAQDGFHATPSLYWKQGLHRVDLNFSTRVRPEWWGAYTDRIDLFEGWRARARLQYDWAERFLLVAEGQFAQLGSMDPNGTGALAVYRRANDGKQDVSAFQLRHLYTEWRPAPSGWARVGRQDVKLGAEIAYTEPEWRYLKTSRLGERLIGSSGWSLVERAGDGVGGGWDFGGYQLNAFAAQPTTGVFAVEDGYQQLKHILYGGAAFTVKRGTWLGNTELSLFGVGWGDDRDRAHGGLPGGVEVGTLGASWLGVYPVGPGRADVLLWGAGQFGDYAGQDQSAGAGIAELGYQLANVFAKPWLRAGINAASGDGDPRDGDHHTFFNLLPTNHLYYGFADQLAFENLVNSFVQLRLAPLPMLALNLFVHWFELAEKNDARYSGTGAFDHKTFGFTASPSNGERDVGREYDVVATLTPHKNITFEAGFAYLDGGNVFKTSADRDVQFAYVSLELRY